MRAVRRPQPRPVSTDIDEQTVVGEVYMRSLVRAQLRLGVLVLLAVGTALGGLPLLFAASPSLREAEVLGLPVPWWLLGVLAYPLVGLAAWAYVRVAERSERDFSDLVERR